MEREFLNDVLRMVERRLERKYGTWASAAARDVFSRAGDCKNADEMAEVLYQLAGYREFSLRLMWVLRLVRLDGTKPDRVVTENEVEQLVLTLAPLFRGETEGTSTGQAQFPSNFGSRVEK